MKYLLPILTGILLTAASALFAQRNDDLDVYPPTAIPDRIILTLSEDPAHSMHVNWRTSVSLNNPIAEIQVAGPSPHFINPLRVAGTTELLNSNRSSANYHSVTFSDLTPNTLYAYRVGDGDHWSEWAHFRTAQEGEAPFSFIYLGDAQNDLKSRWSRVVRQAYSELPTANFMLHAGDLVNKPENDHEWGEWFYAAGWIYRSMPSIATPGNHEYARQEDNSRELSKHWRPTFTFPENGPEELAETAYYIDYQNTRFISINTNALLLQPRKGLIQVRWLDSVLQNNPNQWTIVTMHHPVYSPALERDNVHLRNTLKPMFDKYGVDLVLQGHDHTYARGGINKPAGARVVDDTGPVYVVSVSGPKMYVSNLMDWIDRAAMETQLYQIVHVKKNMITYEAYTAVGELYDRFQILKRPDGTKTFLDRAPEDVPERIGEYPHSRIQSLSPYLLEKWRKRFEEYKARKGFKQEKEGAGDKKTRKKTNQFKEGELPFFQKNK